MCISPSLLLKYTKQNTKDEYRTFLHSSGLENEEVGNKSGHLQLIIDLLRAYILTCQIMRNMPVI